MVFERDDVDVDAFRADLTRTVSDDGTLAEYLDVTTQKRVLEVAACGTIRESLERFVRFTKIVRFHGPALPVFNWVALPAITAVLVWAPVGATVGLTGSYALVYAAFGINRWTFLLAVPATLANLPLMASALARRTFVWGGRRYRWPSKYDVEVVK